MTDLRARTAEDPATERYDLFVSYVDEDREWVQGYLLDALGQAGVRYIHESAFALGAPRVLEFQRAVAQSQRTLLVLSAAYFASSMSEFSDVLAQAYGQETGTWAVIPLQLEDVELPPRLKFLVALDAADPEDWPSVVERLCEELRRPPPGPQEAPACPYPGMTPFSEDDSEHFFGRKAEVDEVLHHLRLHPFLAVIGPSGSGKSSLVAAGVLPALRTTTLFGRTEWVTRTIRPGEAPLAALEAALEGAMENPVQAVDRLLPEPGTSRLLLVVDQLEELFTVGRTGTDEFQETLLRLVAVPACTVVVTMRADFYPSLMATPLWREASQHRVEVLPLQGKELREAIVLPAEGVGVYVESTLVERLLDDAAGEPGLLPLVQETMVCLWERLERRLLPLRAYEALILPSKAYGRQPHTGLQVAMARRADAAMADLPEPQQLVARRILLRLVQFGEGRSDVRRQQSTADLCTTIENRTVFETVLEHLAARRLITLSASSAGGSSDERAVDLAHEALIRGWPTFQDWLGERREGEQVRRRLMDKVAEWTRLGRRDGGLLDPVELLEAQRWLGRPDAEELGADDGLLALVTASAEAHERAEAERVAARRRELAQVEALAAEQRARAEAEAARADEAARAARAARRLARGTVLLGAVTVMVVALVVVASLATAQRRRESRLAQSRQLSAQARSLADEHLDLALLLSQEAYRLSPTDEARGSLIASLQRDPRLVTFFNGHTDRAGPAVISPDGSLVAAGGDDGKLMLWEVTTGRRIDPALEVGDDVRSVAFSPDGSILASGGHHQDRSVILWDVKGRRKVGSLSGHTDDVRSLAFNPADGTQLASGSADGTIRLWDVRTGQSGSTLNQGRPVNAVAFTPDGADLLAGSDGGLVLAWDVQHGSARTVLAATGADVRAVAVSPDGTLLATGGSAPEVTLWDVGTGVARGEPLAGHKERIFTLAFSPDGRTLASGSRDGRVLLWDVATGGSAGAPLSGHADSVRSVAFSPDGRFVLTASDDHRIALWQLNGRLNLASALGRHGDWVGGVAVSPDGRLVASASGDGTVGVRDAVSGEPVGGPLEAGGAVTSVAFSSDGRLLAAGDLDGTVIAWDVSSRQSRFRTTRSGAVLGLVFRPETAVLAVVGGDGNVSLFDVDAGRVARPPLGTDSDQLVSVAASPDGRRLAAGGLDGRLWVWDLDRGAERVLLSCSAERQHLLCGRSVDALAFSADGKLLASGSADKSVSLWDPTERRTDGEPIRQMSGHKGAVRSVAFSSENALASAGADGQVILWGTGMPVGDPFVGHDGPVNALAFAPDGDRLYSVGDDHQILSWDVDFDSWRARACRTANRNLDREEWRLYLGSARGYKATCPEVR